MCDLLPNSYVSETVPSTRPTLPDRRAGLGDGELHGYLLGHITPILPHHLKRT
jgi:hypothetical protein